MGTLRQSFTTTLGAHKWPARVALIGRQMGLEVDVSTAGGWFEKTHLIVARGEDADVWRFQRYLSTVAEEV